MAPYGSSFLCLPGKRQPYPRQGSSPPLLPSISPIDSIVFDGYLQRGHELEAQRRWGEAPAHYEEGLRAISHRECPLLGFQFGTAALRFGPSQQPQLCREGLADAGCRGPRTLHAGAAENRDPLRGVAVGRGSSMGRVLELSTAINEPIFRCRKMGSLSAVSRSEAPRSTSSFQAGFST